MTTYIKAFYGQVEQVEQAVKIFDRIFRYNYNVYGGRREKSNWTIDNETGEKVYRIEMSYTAEWINFSGYRIEDIEKTFWDMVRNSTVYVSNAIKDLTRG